ncbi:hypothetical protein LCGC14_0413620 [marine sediment metagenome]|uniref:Uncharacterized protein n=1 Tax=marine sediment metagenome TaxID=412755 RepID=A0A0F9ST30_9ZZZZ
MFKVGDVITVREAVWAGMHCGSPDELPSGPIVWIQPTGANRVQIEGSGYLFRPKDVELLWADIDVKEFE